jgi:ferredoxin
MILCFGGTGNSLYAAKYIAKIIDDKIVSVNELTRNNAKEKMLSDKPFVFVCPTYAWRIPNIIDKYIKKLFLTETIKPTLFLFVAEKPTMPYIILKEPVMKKDWGLWVSSVVMPGNYILMFYAPDKTETKEIIQKALPHIKNIAENIKEGKTISQQKIGFSDKLKSGVINKLFYRFVISAKGFYSTNDCIVCENCIALCPLKIIRIKDKNRFGDQRVLIVCHVFVDVRILQ